VRQTLADKRLPYALYPRPHRARVYGEIAKRFNPLSCGYKTLIEIKNRNAYQG